MYCEFVINGVRCDLELRTKSPKQRSGKQPGTPKNVGLYECERGHCNHFDWAANRWKSCDCLP